MMTPRKKYMHPTYAPPFFPTEKGGLFVLEDDWEHAILFTIRNILKRSLWKILEELFQFPDSKQTTYCR
jgi:hypothetical protein